MTNAFKITDLTETGKSLFKLYQDILKIDEETAIAIIRNNKSVQLFITGKYFGVLTSVLEAVSIVIKNTLFRKKYDFSPLKASEVDLLKKFYPTVTVKTIDGYIPSNNDVILAKDCVPLVQYYKNLYPESTLIFQALSNIRPE